VKGYTLSFIQDPIEKKLVFMGTEHGLWISINEGKDWVQFNNGFPSVSTMDLVIQEKESALVVGTFGRSIWVLDDLKSLRQIVADKMKEIITALPMNEVVQVKGLFIAPPGNIWTGFGTTFEGENRAFQQAVIPFYINEVPAKEDGVQAFIKNNVGDTIMKLNHEKLSQGLNYISWKLDEERVYLSGNYDSDDSRGIPVLPGIYTASIKYKGNESSTSVKVIADPRFDLKDEVDRELYRFQKAVNKEEGRLNSLLTAVDTLESQLKKIHEQVIKQSKAGGKLKAVNVVIDQVKQLKLQGRDRLENRQVGAWQSNKITPYSAINAAGKAAMARTNIPSDQDWKMLNDATMLIDSYQTAINKFESEQWRKFIKRFKN
jgi:hypothetical protein